jgi:4'-phosphopantetheinyl transferase EntD
MGSNVGEEERALVARAVASRRSEFAAGRRHARIALAQLGIAAAVIGRGRWGEPIWPAGIVGSISHTCDRVGAVVAHGDRAAGIGFDVERLCPETAAVAGSALSDAERRSVARLGPDRRRIAPIVLLSAKEAAFKALFPLVGGELPSFVDLQAVWHPVSRVATVIVPHDPACAPEGRTGACSGPSGSRAHRRADRAVATVPSLGCRAWRTRCSC